MIRQIPVEEKATILASLVYIIALAFYKHWLHSQYDVMNGSLIERAFATAGKPWYWFGSVKPTLTYERGALIREEVQTFSLWPLLLNGYRYSKARGVHVQHQCSGCGS